MLSSVKNLARRLLIRSQDLTGTDNVYIAKQGFWSTFGFAANSLLSFAVVWSFANFLPKELYGTYKYLLSLVASITFLALSGINTAVAQAVSRGQHRALEYAVRFQLKWNLMFISVGIAIGGYYLYNGNSLFAYAISLLCIEWAISSALNTYGPYLAARKQFKKVALYSFVSAFFYGICMLIAVFATDSLFILISVYVSASLIPVFIIYRITLRSVHGPELSREQKSALLRYAGHLSLVNIVPTVAQSIDKILAFQYAGPAALATYAFASVGPDRVRGWLKSVGGIIFPKLAERSLAEIDRVFYRRVLQAILVGCAAAAAYSTAAPYVFQVFFPQYIESVRYSQVLSLSLIGISAAVYIGQVVTAHKLLGIIYRGSLAVHGGKIILFIVMGYLWGIWGLILSTVCAQCFNTAWHSFLWYWYVRRPLRT